MLKAAGMLGVVIWKPPEEKASDQCDWEGRLAAALEAGAATTETLPCQVHPCLLLGSAAEAADPARLAARGVTHVYSCCVVNSSLRVADAKAADFASAGLAWRGVAAQDAADYPMLANHFDDFRAFCDAASTPSELCKSAENEEAAKGSEGGEGPAAAEAAAEEATPVEVKRGLVLVHCAAGINRSGALAMAYVMHRERMPLLEAARHCAAQRGPLLWNRGFREQLVQYARAEGLLG
jgi:hypothetical protein